MTAKEFITKYYQVAKETEKKTGIPALAILAQAALESGWGEAAPGYNFFGMKAGKYWKGKKQLLTTTEYHADKNKIYPEILSIEQIKSGLYKYKVKDWFRAYDSPEEGFADHAKLFLLPRYATAMKNCNNVEKFVEEIAKAKYATNLNYAQKLIRTIKIIKSYL